MSPKAAARLLPQTLFMLLVLCNAADASTADRDAALRRCREQFGPAVDAARNLFEVNRWYVLEVKFDARSRLSELNVVPKRYFAEAHPEWEEPDAPDLEAHWARYLTRYDYEKLLQRLDHVEPKGGLLRRGVSGVVTNMTAPVKDLYERAELNRGEVLDLRRGDYAPALFRYVRLRYLGPAELNRALRRGGRLPKGTGGRELLKLTRRGRTVDQRR